MQDVYKILFPLSVQMWPISIPMWPINIPRRSSPTRPGACQDCRCQKKLATTTNYSLVLLVSSFRDFTTMYRVALVNKLTKMLQTDKVYCRQQSINNKLNNKRKGKHFPGFFAVQRVSGRNDGRRMEWTNIVGSYLHIKVVITFGGWAAIAGSVPPQKEERSGNSGLVSILMFELCCPLLSLFIKTLLAVSRTVLGRSPDILIPEVCVHPVCPVFPHPDLSLFRHKDLRTLPAMAVTILLPASQQSRGQTAAQTLQTETRLKNKPDCLVKL